ncbi:hypothetical protein NA637_15515, partial [Pseudomonas stutzeri]|nr:hypothetical protein [Stutzerimonas stutzeri]
GQLQPPLSRRTGRPVRAATAHGAEMRLLTLGTISLDGIKIRANASRHSTLSHGHIEQLENRLKHDEVQALFALAEQADQASVPDGMNLPEEIARRETRLAAMAAAKSKMRYPLAEPSQTGC